MIFFSKRPYSLDLFDDYEKHFTVMNYKPAVNLKQVIYFYQDFDRFEFKMDCKNRFVFKIDF
jgi:hypothetical protein